MSELQKLSLSNVHKLSRGMCGGEFDREIQRIFEDIRDRPGEDGKRSVTLRIEIKPKASQRFDIDTATLGYKVSTSFPNIKDENIHLEIGSDNTAQFFDHGQDETPLEREVNEAKIQPMPGNGTNK